MASALFWGPDEAITTSTVTSSMTDGSANSSTAHAQAPQTSMTEQSAPPSPNHISAAAILATLSEGRPSSHEQDMEDAEDDHGGGIALHVDEEVAMLGTYTYALPAPPLFVPAQVDEALHPIGTSSFEDMLDQHAAALDSLSMEQPLSTGLPFSSGTTIQQFLMSHVSVHDLDFEANLNPAEEYLNHLNKDRFLSVASFYRHFASDSQHDYIGLDACQPPAVIDREDLRGDECDIQGINWSLLRTSRTNIRAKRRAFEDARLSPQLVAVRKGMVSTPNTENYFSFTKMDTTHQAFVPHFQLRNLMVATSRNDVFYADRDMVYRTDLTASPATTVMNLSKESTEAGKFQITTLAALDDVLLAGGFEGEYALANLSDTMGTPATVGRINHRSRDSKSHITNHVHLFASRNNYAPQAVLSSNDHRLRVLDCHTTTFTYSFPYPAAVNCSATSPNGRMRVVVGDFRETLITNAETGQPFETLNTHTDDAFACDWADDGIHVATAAQDSTIVVWDARYWAQPLKVLSSELSIPRCLKFSPVGGGPRVLVCAEADDYVNVINAQTFESKQVFDFFGRTAGISMTPDGSSLFVANSEPHFGGIMEFERCGWGERRRNPKRREDEDEEEEEEEENDGVVVVEDWSAEDALEYDHRVVCGWRERQRRGIKLGSLVV